MELYILEDPADFLISKENASFHKKLSPSSLASQDSQGKLPDHNAFSSQEMSPSAVVSVTPNDYIYGFESGRHVDKEHCVLVLIGQSTVHCMAMNGLDEMFRWADILDKILKEYKFHVSLLKCSDGSRLHKDPGTLHIQSSRLCLIAEPAQGNKFICSWPFADIDTDARITHQGKECYFIHVSNKGSGRGKHILHIEDKSLDEFFECLRDMKASHLQNGAELDSVLRSGRSSSAGMFGMSLPATSNRPPQSHSSLLSCGGGGNSVGITGASYSGPVGQQHHLHPGGSPSSAPDCVSAIQRKINSLRFNNRKSPLSPGRVRGTSECERGSVLASDLKQRRSSDISIPPHILSRGEQPPRLHHPQHQNHHHHLMPAGHNAFINTSSPVPTSSISSSSKFSPILPDSSYYNISNRSRYSTLSSALVSHSRANSSSQQPNDLLFTPDEDYCENNASEYYPPSGMSSVNAYMLSVNQSHNMGSSLDSSSLPDGQSISSLVSPADGQQALLQSSSHLKCAPLLFQIGEKDISTSKLSSQDNMGMTSDDRSSSSAAVAVVSAPPRRCRSLEFSYTPTSAGSRDEENSHFELEATTNRRSQSMSVRRSFKKDYLRPHFQFRMRQHHRHYVPRSYSFNALSQLDKLFHPTHHPLQAFSHCNASLLSPIREGQHFLQSSKFTDVSLPVAKMVDMTDARAVVDSSVPDVLVRPNIRHSYALSATVDKARAFSYHEANVTSSRGGAGGGGLHNYVNVSQNLSPSQQPHIYSNIHGDGGGGGGVNIPEHSFNSNFILPDEMRFPQMNYARVDFTNESSRMRRMSDYALLARDSMPSSSHVAVPASPPHPLPSHTNNALEDVSESHLNYANLFPSGNYYSRSPSNHNSRSSSSNYARSSKPPPPPHYSSGGGVAPELVYSHVPTASSSGSARLVPTSTAFMNRQSDYAPIDPVKTKALAEMILSGSVQPAATVSAAALSQAASSMSPHLMFQGQGGGSHSTRESPASSYTAATTTTSPGSATVLGSNERLQRSRSILSSTSTSSDRRFLFFRLQRKKSEATPS